MGLDIEKIGLLREISDAKKELIMKINPGYAAKPEIEDFRTAMREKAQTFHYQSGESGYYIVEWRVKPSGPPPCPPGTEPAGGCGCGCACACECGCGGS